MRCFQLSGSSVRLCLPSGHWSGEPPVCRVKTCRQITPPANGFVSCSSNNYAVDTVCEFGCNYGYKLIGSKKRMCLPISLWAGLPAYCKRKWIKLYSELNFNLLCFHSHQVSSSAEASLWRGLSLVLFNKEALLRRSVCLCLQKRIQVEGSILQTMSRQGIMERRTDNDTMHW